MTQSGIYTLQAQLISLQSNAIPPGPITATLRTGKNTHNGIFYGPHESSLVLLSTNLQLCIDHLALTTQRCSISLSAEGNSIIGIAQLSLPQKPQKSRHFYSLIRSKDKSAQLTVDLELKHFQSSQKIEQTPQKKQTMLNQNISKTEERKTLLRVRSNPSIETSITKKSLASDERSITVKQEVVRLRREKEAYYQLYQIEKSKSQKAAEFISSFVGQITAKYPHIAKNLSGCSNPAEKRKQREQEQLQKSTVAQQQLQQANRSLHRQLEEYKKINQQLKSQLLANHPQKGSKSTLMPPGGIYDLVPTKSTIKNKRQNILSPLKSELQPSSPLADIDLKKWLEQSVGQRQDIKKMLQTAPRKSQPQNGKININKTRASINKAYVALLSRAIFTRQTILSHKRQINSLLDELQ